MKWRSPAEPSSPDNPKKRAHSRKGGRTLTYALTGSIAFVATVGIATVVAWQIDERNHADRVARATSVAGTSVSDKTDGELRTALTALEVRLQTAAIDIGHENQKFTTTGDAFGLDLDVDATAERVMRATHDASGPERFGRFVASHFRRTAETPIVTFDSTRLASVVSDKDPGPRTQPTNPTIEYKDAKFSVVDGIDGRGLVNADAPDAVRAAVKKGFPLVAEVETGVVRPLSTPDDMNDLVTRAEKVTSVPLSVGAGSKSGSVGVDQLKPLIRTAAAGDRLQLDIDTEGTKKALEAALPDAGTKVVEAGYDVQNNTPVPIEGRAGTTCCDDAAAALVATAILARQADADPNAKVEVPLRTVQPKRTKADLPDLGIKEVIGTFTTNHPANQPRVTNIHLISDLTRGAVVPPGETFSINDYVGRRTTEKGFVVDHVIEDGKFAESVGGGISQYATTLFNAAFFGGLDFGEYQSHSIYIDRYPYGREATVSFPHPDLQIKNTSPHGVLIWPTYTNTSLTITLYSTKYASGDQTNQTTGPSGNCTRVRTERTRTYVDGRTATDTVGALYQPKEGEKC